MGWPVLRETKRWEQPSPSVLGSPEMFVNPKPAPAALRKLQITSVFAGILIKLITTGLPKLIPFLTRTWCTTDVREDARIKYLLFLLISFSMHKN